MSLDVSSHAPAEGEGPLPRLLTRTTGSPGTDDPFGLPLRERLEASGLVLGDVQGDDDVVRHRPLLSSCVGVVCPTETRESDWDYGRGAGSGRGIGCLAQMRARGAKG